MVSRPFSGASGGCRCVMPVRHAVVTWGAVVVRRCRGSTRWVPLFCTRRPRTLCGSAYFWGQVQTSQGWTAISSLEVADVVCFCVLRAAVQSVEITVRRCDDTEITIPCGNGLEIAIVGAISAGPSTESRLQCAAAGNRDLGRLARCSRRLWFRARTMRPKTLWRYFAGLEGSAGDTHNGFVCGSRGRSGGPGTSRTGAVRRCRGQ